MAASCPTGDRLSPYVRHHERLDYSRAQVEALHQRHRRHLSADAPPVQLDFQALERHFRLRLRRDVAAFAAGAVLVGPGGEPEPLLADHVYEGHLEGEWQSAALVLGSGGVWSRSNGPGNVLNGRQL